MRKFASNGQACQPLPSDIKVEEKDEDLQPPPSPVLPRKSRPPYPSPPPAPQRIPHPPGEFSTIAFFFHP